MITNRQENHVLECKIEDKILRYDFAAYHKNDYDNYPIASKLEYIGEGIVYSYDGIIQTCDRQTICHFWKLKQ